MNEQFKDKIAIITGGTQGLGVAIATLFAKRGAKQILTCGRRPKQGEKVAKDIQANSDCEVSFVQADVSKVLDCRKVVATCLERYGRVDILVNVAGCTERGNILDTSEELFDMMFNTNVKGPFYLMQDTAKAMRKQFIKGAIVNIGSVAALAGQPFLAPYSASKGALEILTKNTAFALMADQIRVNCLNIGWMNTEGEDRIQKQYHDKEDGWLDNAKQSMPFGRLLEPTEVAKAVAFLASEESGMMTGESIIFDQTIPGAFMSHPTPERLED